MLGAIAGDVIGSVHEHAAPRDKHAFRLFTSESTFTDDTVMTVAVANALRSGADYAQAFRTWGRRYPDVGYGGFFRRWLLVSSARPYGSYGNGSAMRVSPVAWVADEPLVVENEAERSAAVTHDHPEGVRGARAVAAAVLLARQGGDKPALRALLEARFGYDCSVSLEEWRRRGGFDVTCQGTIPRAAAAVLESTDFEDALRNAISLGGDTDTNAAIAGAIAEPLYGGVPPAIAREVWLRLDDALRAEVAAFARAFDVPLPE